MDTYHSTELGAFIEFMETSGYSEDNTLNKPIKELLAQFEQTVKHERQQVYYNGVLS